MVKNWLDGATASVSITVLAGLALLATAQPAKAGFEWTPPPAAAAAPPVAAAPAPAVDAEMLDEPMPMPMSEAAPVMGSPMPMMRKVEPAPVMRPVSPPAPVEAANVPAPVMSAPSGPDFATAVGFGDDIPLVLAMRQIVPADYSYSFDQGVNPGARISWSGGKAWDETLADAVRPHGLEVVISDNTVWLRQGWVDAEKIRASAASAADMTMGAAPPMQEIEPVAVPIMPEPAPVMAQDAVPVPLSIPEAAPEPTHQSYPRRQRPAMVEMIYEQQAMPVAPATDAYIADYSDGPVPLMKALPPPPPEPVTPPKNATPAPVMNSSMAATQPLAMRHETRGPVMNTIDIHFWQADQGDSLKELLNRWASKSNVAMLWNSPYDYALPAPVRMHGTFADAVTSVLMTYGMADPRPLGRLHPNLPNGPSVLVIENYTQATN